MALIGRPARGRSLCILGSKLLGMMPGKLGLALALSIVLGYFAAAPVVAQAGVQALAPSAENARDSVSIVAQADQPVQQVQWALRDDAAASRQATVPFGALPAEAKDTSEMIRRGGPFPYRQDGVPFGNRERSLPAQRRGYYREYTVPTPHARNRGARRIVCGGQQPTAPEACYYTNDHYATFRLIVQ